MPRSAQRLRPIALLPLLWLGCTQAAPDGPAVGVDGSDGIADGDDGGAVEGQVTGAEPGAGFGAAVAAHGERVWVGAPHGARGAVYAIDGTRSVEVIVGGGRLGASLSLSAAGGLAGAPLADQALDADGSVLATGPSAGLAVARADDGRWAVAWGDGVSREDGTEQGTPGRPASLAFSPDALAVGVPVGPTAALLGDTRWSRPERADEAGYSVASGDVDGDGDPEWFVGAPGARAVWVLRSDGTPVARIGSELGRFGHSIAVADVDGDGLDDLLVGAPTDSNHRGAAALFTRGDFDAPAATWAGPQPGDQLGFAVAAATDRLVLGAPGGPGAPGFVQVLPAP